MVCPRRGQWVSTEEVCFFPLVLYAMLCAASSPAVTHGVSPPGTEGAYAEEFRPAYRVQSVDNFTHYDRHTESQQSSVSHATAPVAEYLTPPAEVHHA